MLSKVVRNRKSSVASGLGSLVMMALGVLPAQAATPIKVVSSVPVALQQASNRGVIEASTPIRVTVWLNMHNKAAFDQRVEAIYTPGSPTYHKWLTKADLMTYAPTAAELKTVQSELEKQGLAAAIDPANPFAIRAKGSAERVQAAFGTQINLFEKNGATFHANVTEAHLEGDAAGLVLSVSGLNSKPVQSMIAEAGTPKAIKPTAIPLAKEMTASAGLSTYFTNQCFQEPSAFTFGAPGQLPVGVYYGNVYSQGTKTCGYTPAQMRTAYALPAVYSAGLNGAGQTIVVLIPYGSTTILSDANKFNTMTGLPALNSSNLKVIYPEGPPVDPILGESWIREASMDVEWAHAIAPSAKIVLLAAASGDNQDLAMGIEYAVLNNLGCVISNSYAIPETELTSADLQAYNQAIEQAAAMGISVNFASGDHSDEGLGTPAGAVSAPADSPYATAVGGTSIGVPGGTGWAKEVGWGNNLTALAYVASTVQDPPVNYGNYGGSGGGSSSFFAKPSWQGKLPGPMRQVPDVSMAADPYTGAIVIYTDPVAGPMMQSVGGTSLSCPMFSAIWAMANQKAGHMLGQAGPIVARMPSSAIHDVVPGTSLMNVVGTIISNTGAQFYSPAQLAQPVESSPEFTSAIWQISGEYLTLTFGTTSSLTVTKGWDNVTGYGTPIGLPFITAAAKY